MELIEERPRILADFESDWQSEAKDKTPTIQYDSCDVIVEIDQTLLGDLEQRDRKRCRTHHLWPIDVLFENSNWQLTISYRSISACLEAEKTFWRCHCEHGVLLERRGPRKSNI